MYASSAAAVEGAGGGDDAEGEGVGGGGGIEPGGGEESSSDLDEVAESRSQASGNIEEEKESAVHFDGTAVPATFQIVYMIGWKQSDTTPKALARGSAKRSLKDLGFSSDAFLA